MQATQRFRSAARQWPLSAAFAGHPLVAVLTVALVARFSIALAVSALHGGQLFGDDKTYYDLAAQRASGNTAAWTPYVHSLYRTTAAYTLPMTGLFKLFGPRVLLGQLYTAVLGALAAAGTTAVAREVLRPRFALVSGLIVALLPSQILWSSLTLKDAAVWLVLVAIALTVAVNGRSTDHGKTVAGLLAVAVLLLTMGFLRHHTFVVACWAAGIASWVGAARTRFVRGGFTVAVALILPVALGLGVAGLGLVTSSTATLATRRANNAAGAGTAVVAALPRPTSLISGTSSRGGTAGAGGDTGAAPTADPAAPAALPISSEVGGGSSVHYLPRGLAVILLEPAPWIQTRNSRIRFAQLETLVWWPLLMLAVVGLWRVRQCPRVLAFPALAGGAIAMTYGLSEGNFGTAFRHRGELVWAVALLAGAGAEQLLSGRQVMRPTPGSDVPGLSPQAVNSLPAPGSAPA